MIQGFILFHVVAIVGVAGRVFKALLSRQANVNQPMSDDPDKVCGDNRP